MKVAALAAVVVAAAMGAAFAATAVAWSTIAAEAEADAWDDLP